MMTRTRTNRQPIGGSTLVLLFLLAEPIRQALAADPRSDGWYGLLAIDLMALGRLNEAERVTQEQMSLQTSAYAQARLSSIEVLRGNAAAALAKAEQVPPGKLRDFALANARQIGDDTASADAALKALIDKYGKTDPYLIARCYALRKDPNRMFASLDRAWAPEQLAKIQFKVTLPP